MLIYCKLIYDTSTVSCPACEMEISPAHIQLSLQLLFSAGMLAIKTSSVPGVHGATVTGTQGMGVSTPIAAEVAAATSGLASEEHIANGGIFTMGLLSKMLATGTLLVITLFTGKTIKEDGAAPNEQVIMAPMHTSCDIFVFLGFYLKVLF